jgi:hypothetical protein
MVSERASQRAFFGVSALLFAASAAVTIVWCASMPAMSEMPMLGGRTMSMAWMRMPGQTWPGAAASGFGGPAHFAFENDLQRNLPVESVIDVATIHTDEPLAGPKRHQSVGHRSPDGAERNSGPRHPLMAAPDASRVAQNVRHSSVGRSVRMPFAPECAIGSVVPRIRTCLSPR